MKFSSSILSALAIISIGLTVRLYRVNQPLLEFFPPRQTQTAEITRNIYFNGWRDFWTPKVRYFTPRQDSGQAGESTPYVLEFPFYNGIVVIFYHLFGPNIIWGRTVSLGFFIASSVVFYQLVKLTMKQFLANGQSAFGGNSLSILALLFFVFSPLHILTSRTFQPEELALFLLLTAVYKKSWLIFSLAVLTKLPIALFAPVMFYSSSMRGSASIVKSLLSLLPSFIWYFRAGSLAAEEHVARNFTLSNWFQPKLWLTPGWYGALFQIEVVWIFTLTGLLMFLLGIWHFQTDKFKLWRWWLGCGIIYLTLFNYHAKTHEYYHILLLPPLAVIMGKGLASIFSGIPSPPWKKILAISSIVAFIMVSLAKPAIEKISRSPKTVMESDEMTVYRYNLTTTF